MNAVLTKKVWFSKTMWFNLLTIAAGVLATLAGQDFIAENPDTAALLAMIIGAVNLVLRWITSTKLIV